MIVLVDGHNRVAMPLPVGTLVKWEQWREYETNAGKFVEYYVRCTKEPVPEKFLELDFNKADERRSYLAILEVGDKVSLEFDPASVSEGVIHAIPYVSFGARVHKENEATLFECVRTGRVANVLEGCQCEQVDAHSD